MLNMSELNMHYVYAHKNPTTMELFYIGVGYGKRCFRFKCGRNKRYLEYVETHGNPVVEIIHKELSKEEAYALELEFISRYGRRGYEPHGILLNVSVGGGHSNYGSHHTEETKIKISQNTQGKKRHSDEQKEKWSQERKGRKVIWDPNIVKSDKGRPKPEGFGKCRHRKVLQFDLDGNFIKEWNSFKDIWDELNIRNAAIWSNIKGNTHQCGGFTWKYKE